MRRQWAKALQKHPTRVQRHRKGTKRPAFEKNKYSLVSFVFLSLAVTARVELQTQKMLFLQTERRGAVGLIFKS